MSQLSKKKLLAIGVFACTAIVLLLVFAGLTSTDRSIIFSSPRSITVGNTERTYRMHQASEQTRKIIVAIHGFNGSGRGLAYNTGLHNVSGPDTTVVYPDALSNNASALLSGWNARFCCGAGWQENADDIAFILQLIETIKSEQAAGSAKVFITGFSNGAFMAHRIAAEKPDTIDGFAAVAGTIGTSSERFSPALPVPALLVHGAEDGIVTYNGGPGSDPSFDWLPFSTTATTWASNNNCSITDIQTTETEEPSSYSYPGCTAPTKTIVYKERGHTWGDWRIFNIWHSKPNLSRDIVSFFNAL